MNALQFRFNILFLVGCFALVSLFLGGCVNSRQLAYFQTATSAQDTLALGDRYVPPIKRGDVLSIQVSSLSAEASAIFNPYSSISVGDGNTVRGTNTSLPQTSGYLVGDSGTVALPLIGQVKLEGLSNGRAAEVIRTKLRTYLKEPTVSVRNQNFRVSVLGEVTRPSLFTIPNEQLTLPEALGLAGDLTIYGRRDNVLIIREEGNKRTFARIDLTNRNAFQSPFYYLHPNDVVYVEPGKARIASTDRLYQISPIVLGILSIVAIILTRPR
ncbi:polysaccharide biosynthesis/export family protein [Fibrella aquatilis]|uniref:Polysaccharide biosynthesis/export family protein n=1 Tax=Fibrella aquatilis TaxID=2817059 RepID=A0A939G926_9BACT|nr:polysaccharide biosynthesis/export family protein [Fibrella aquatilis]MBO0932058.1 polysaccharide biosynthesis/export family protein [Fibrella aquatilis]